MDNLYMVYIKMPNDKKYSPMNIITGEVYNRLVYAPRYKEELLPDIRNWIESNKQNCPDINIQIRIAGTNKII